MRQLIVPKSSKKLKAKENSKTDKTGKPLAEATSQDMLIAPLSWAQRLKTVFNIDITLCPHHRLNLRLLFNPKTRLDKQVNITLSKP